MASSKSFQNYLIISIVALLVLLIAAKYFYNVQSKKYQWTEQDRSLLIEKCKLDVGSFAIRFPDLTEEYCTCAIDSIMAHFEKADYLRIESKDFEDKIDYFRPVILDCYNHYQTRIFEESEMPD